MSTQPSQKRSRRWWRLFIRLTLAGAALIAALVLFWLRDALYNRFIRFPREQAAWQAIRSQRQTVAPDPRWHEWRGILHSHSELSHDSEVPLGEILRVLKATRLDFICLSDHCVDGRADFNLQWRGLRDGKLFIPGFEMKEGIMPFGVSRGVVLSNRTDASVLARQIAEGGGLLFYAHPEEPRAWDCPELTGMEIYNLHTDFKRLKRPLVDLLPDVLLNLNRFPEHLYTRMLTRPTDFLRRWDALNRTRHITGIAGNDCHQNVGWRGIYVDRDRVRIEDTSPETLKELHLNAFTRPLARLLFGPLETNRTLFHIQLDPYERSARFVNTHVLARELSEAALLDALRHGRAFIGFDMIADSAGFQWSATSAEGGAVMGESLAFSSGLRLSARSPLPCRFTIVKDGQPVHQAEGRTLEWTPPGKGKYRVEAELNILQKWTPWVYVNPIELR